MCNVKIHGHIQKQILTYFFSRLLLTFSFPQQREYTIHMPLFPLTPPAQSTSLILVISVEGNEVERPFHVTGPEIT